MDCCMFDSKLTEYKRPFGAVPLGEEVCFHVALPKTVAAEKLSLCVYHEEQLLQEIPMVLCQVNEDRNWYTASLYPKEAGLYFYSFSYEAKGEQVHLNPDAEYCAVQNGSARWQLTVYEPQPSPSAIGDGIYYQIFPDRFRRSGQQKQGVPADRCVRDDWGQLPIFWNNEQGVFDCNDYFGGDLQGIIEKLDDLRALGVSCLYLNPIFEAHSNHRYNVADYKKIDPLLGSEDDFKQLCQEAKQRGIAVILDGVFSHTGSDSLYFNKEGRYGANKGAYRDPDSPYRPWYQFTQYPEQYESWWGFETLPNVKEEQEEYLNFICRDDDSVVHHWMNAGASGFRLDVADELPDIFLDEIRKAVKSHGEDKVLIGEVWEDASNKIAYGQRRRYLLGKQLDSVMNYPFRTAVLDYMRQGNGTKFLQRIRSIVENYPESTLSCAMNPLSTHDTERALTVLAGEACQERDRYWQAAQHYLPKEAYEKGLKALKLAYCLLYFLPGVPSLYYGDEAGLSGYGDPFNRCCYPWGFENHDLVAWFRRLGQMRKQISFLKQSHWIPYLATEQMVSFLRYQSDKQQLLLAVNRSEEPCTLSLPPIFASQTPTLLCGGYEKGCLQGESAVLFVLQEE